MKRSLLLLLSHAGMLALGFGLGLYLLPILTAPPAPSTLEMRAGTGEALYQAEFRRNLRDSDTFHWGEGKVSIGSRGIALAGRLAPGPDYKLYLSPEFVETEADFKRLKSRMVQVGDVKTFDNFIVPLPPQIDPGKYRAVIVWCEAFGQFITAAQYR
jgi:hypothetical protein